MRSGKRQIFRAATMLNFGKATAEWQFLDCKRGVRPRLSPRAFAALAFTSCRHRFDATTLRSRLVVLHSRHPQGADVHPYWHIGTPYNRPTRISGVDSIRGTHSRKQSGRQSPVAVRLGRQRLGRTICAAQWYP
jgi:hypothetical protein